MLVLGDKVRESALGQSLLQRLHELYHEKLPFDNPYTGKKCSNFSNFASLNNPNIFVENDVKHLLHFTNGEKHFLLLL